MLTEDGLTIMLREMRETSKGLGRALESERNLERAVDKHQRTIHAVGERLTQLENQNLALRQRIKDWEGYVDKLVEAVLKATKKHKITISVPASEPLRDIPF